MRRAAARRPPGDPRGSAGCTVADARQRSCKRVGVGIRPPAHGRVRAAGCRLRQSRSAVMNSHDHGVAAPAPPITPSCEQALASLPAEVYLIGCGAEPRNDSQPAAQSMGFKAWNLLRMARMSLPVPQAFVLGTR